MEHKTSTLLTIIKVLLISIVIIFVAFMVIQENYRLRYWNPPVYLYELTLKDNSKVQLYDGKESKDYFSNGSQSIMKSEVKSFKKTLIKKDKEWFFENY